MWGRPSFLVVAAAAAMLGAQFGCDRDAATVADSTSAASRPDDEPRRIPLIAAPLTAEVPPTWDVRRASGGSLVLSGRTPSGEREIAIRVAPAAPIDAVPATQPFTPDSPGSPSGTRVLDADGMRVVERLERVAAIDEPAEIAKVRWSFRFLVPSTTLERPAYELEVLDLTQLGYERDESTLRPIFDSIRRADAP